jgi:hypothetical protein
MIADGVDHGEPFALADPVFEVGAQLLTKRGAMVLVEAAGETFEVFPRFHKFARADGPDRVSLVDRDRRPSAFDFALVAALAREPARRPDGERNSRDADHFDADGEWKRGNSIPRMEALEKTPALGKGSKDGADATCQRRNFPERTGGRASVAGRNRANVILAGRRKPRLA